MNTVELIFTVTLGDLITWTITLVAIVIAAAFIVRYTMNAMTEVVARDVDLQMLRFRQERQADLERVKAELERLKGGTANIAKVTGNG